MCCNSYIRIIDLRRAYESLELNKEETKGDEQQNEIG